MAYGAPNFLAAIDAFRQGRDDARRSYLQDLDERARGLQGKALQGDQSALAELSTIKPEAYMQTQQFTDAQKKERLGEFLSAAYGAKTPEAWNGVVQRFAAQGHKFAPGEDAFENRENLIRQGMTVAEQMGMDFRQSEAARSQANSDRAYNLDERQFAAGQANAAAQRALEEKKMAAEAGKAMRPDLRDITSIRKEIQDLPSYKSYSAALPIYNTMVDASQRDSKAADLNMVYGLAKIYDPTSVVREGETVMVRDTASLPDWLVGTINGLNGGARLQPGTRTAMMQEAKSRIDAYKSAFDSNMGQFRGIASRSQINEQDIMPVMPEVSQMPAEPPGAGTTKSGLKFQVNP